MAVNFIASLEPDCLCTLNIRAGAMVSAPLIFGSSSGRQRLAAAAQTTRFIRLFSRGDVVLDL